MRYFSNSTAILLILAFAAYPASAQTENEQGQPTAAAGGDDCQVVQQELEQRIAENPELRAGFNSTLVRDLRDMRDTAMRLERYGQIEACNAVAAAMQEMIENPARFAQEAGQTGSAEAGEDEQTAANGAEPAWDARIAQDVSQAVPIAEIGGRLRVEEMIGSDVRGAGGELIGEVDDVVLAGSGEPAYAIVAYGGFLGMGEKLAAVPFDRLRISEDRDVVYMPLQRAELEEAPTFERGDYGWMQDEQWREANEAFYAGG